MDLEQMVTSIFFWFWQEWGFLVIPLRAVYKRKFEKDRLYKESNWIYEDSSIKTGTNAVKNVIINVYKRTFDSFNNAIPAQCDGLGPTPFPLEVERHAGSYFWYSF